MGFTGMKKKYHTCFFSTLYEKILYKDYAYMNIELTKMLHVHVYIASEREKKSPLPTMST